LNIAIVLVCLTVAFAAGVFVGRKYEQKIVAVTLAEFAKVDAEAKSLVNRCYRYFTGGVQAKLKKLL